MNPDDLARILDELGRRLGPAGEHVFALAVRQQIIANALWAAALAAVVIASSVVLVRTFQDIRSIREAIVGLDRVIDEHETKDRDIRDRITQFDREHEAARLEAMTPEQRKDWYETQRLFLGYTTYTSGYHSRPNVNDIREANERGWFVIAGCGLIDVAAAIGLLLVLPSLLNPEYAALRDILGAIR